MAPIGMWTPDDQASRCPPSGPFVLTERGEKRKFRVALLDGPGRGW